MGNESIQTVWANGFGPIKHSKQTIEVVQHFAQTALTHHFLDESSFYNLLTAADKLTCVALNVVAHMTYANTFKFSNQPLQAHEFKVTPEGHTGGALNMVPAFIGYLLANILSGKTRGWIMGQGHCAAAIEAINALTGDVSLTQKGRYDATESGLTQLIQDFYSYAIDDEGYPAVPLGSHAGPNTAGAISEGGYLGFAELQYIHMPLPGESLVAFLSDGAFEEQRGSDWAPRWWRAEDSGISIPVMILNGRRIEQRTQIIQEGGAHWLAEDLRHNGFEPMIVDGRDPIAIAIAIVNAERALEQYTEANLKAYPAPLPYIIAETEKGFGFYGAGTNAAHNLPLISNPHTNEQARDLFNQSAAALYVPESDVISAIAQFKVHNVQNRALESQHLMAKRSPKAPKLPLPAWIEQGHISSAMTALDDWFVHFVQENPDLRVRIGNPDELASNKMGKTLNYLKHRVNMPEPNVPEDVFGSVITALNEEAVAAAALGNKAGLNLIVSYEAFAVKMLGILRQEIIFARRQKELQQQPQWIGIPLVVTSHTWENSKNEQSHQDPTIAETLLSEMSDTSRVLFPVDSNTAVAVLRDIYGQRGQLACVVVSKRDMGNYFNAQQTEELIQIGAAHLYGSPTEAQVQLIAVGSYQLEECIKAHEELEKRNIRSCVTVMIEPGKFRIGRDKLEKEFVHEDEVVEKIFPAQLPRVIVSHTRPEALLGTLRRIDNGPLKTRALGYINRGGTFDVKGMLIANKCTYKDVIKETLEIIS